MKKPNEIRDELIGMAEAILLLIEAGHLESAKFLTSMYRTKQASIHSAILIHGDDDNKKGE